MPVVQTTAKTDYKIVLDSKSRFNYLRTLKRSTLTVRCAVPQTDCSTYLTTASIRTTLSTPAASNGVSVH